MGNSHSRNAAKKKSLVKLANLISPVPSDIEVAQAATVVPIKTIAAACGLNESDYEPYGHYKAKVRRRVARGVYIRVVFCERSHEANALRVP